MTIERKSPGPITGLPNPAAIRILVAEDPFVGSFLRTMLQRRGHEVTISDPERAGQMLGAGTIQAHIVITNRPEPFRPLAKTLPILYIAANPDPEVARDFPVCRILRKPFRNEDLLDAVEELAHAVLP